jgi:hypothetical protein
MGHKKEWDLRKDLLGKLFFFCSSSHITKLISFTCAFWAEKTFGQINVKRNLLPYTSCDGKIHEARSSSRREKKECY